MNVNRLINTFFSNQEPAPIIEVFDRETIYSTYRDIVGVLSRDPEVELSILQGLSYCFYELLDNVLIHSKKECGTVLMQCQADSNRIQILVADDGIGIRESLAENPLYKDLSDMNALQLCIKDSVTDGKGMGFGLYSTLKLVENAGVVMIIASGHFMLTFDGKNIQINSIPYWQGTVVYLELHSDKEIRPNEILENRTDCESQYNDEFMGEDELNNLW